MAESPHPRYGGKIVKNSVPSPLSTDKDIRQICDFDISKTTGTASIAGRELGFVIDSFRFSFLICSGRRGQDYGNQAAD